MDKLLGALGLCRKAGKIIMGTDPVAEAMQKGKVKLVVTAQDFAPRSQKQAASLCERFQIPLAVLPHTMEELSVVTGKYVGVIAVCDAGFARMMRPLLEQETR